MAELKPETKPGPDPDWFKNHAIGLVTLVIGAVGFIVVALTQKDFWKQPDMRIAVPFLVAAIAGAVVSITRREGAVAIPLLGVGAAAAAMVLGFVMVFAIVLACTALVILVMSKFF